ncbi:MAG: GMC family oxidoreductase [Gammaproteobacteria bacterium]|nr:GMC family oxidoreductase [Gammaproteobacteria bacterium]MYH85344.1 GMC family oxidoreductase [Gammaproteobacteria bacterium]MYK05255.1 GMC family oxidoreductase [Gammaproteobacteria bacterium]
MAEATEFDAIVVGSGMSGGMSAKELCERGLRVLVLERGPEIVPERDYSDNLAPWESPNFDNIAEDEVKDRYFRQHPGAPYAVKESNKDFWVRDDIHDYVEAEGTRYEWLRGYHTAGRSIMWSRQTYRLGPQDFEENLREGVAIDWPVRYEDIAPWYEKVETFVGIAGSEEGLSQLPDSVFQPAFELTEAEKAFKRGVETAFPGRNVIPARVAHLTDATEEQRSLGRSNCQLRNRCHHGCVFRAYFSSLNATLPAAERTGNLTMVHNAIVQSLEYDPGTNRVSGVRIVDAETGETRTYTGRIVFLNASAIASAMILLQSTSESFPNGLANRSDQVGRNLMDHVSGAGAAGIMRGFDDRKVFGRRPGGIYIPRYANVTENDKPYSRGFGYQGGASPLGHANGQIPGIGREFKESHRRPGPWRISIGAFGEQLPNPDNRVTLHPTRRDRWGNPLAVFEVRYSRNEEIMLEEARTDAIAMLEAAGCEQIASSPVNLTNPGNRIHEMGSARMGRDPADSVLNGWCQAHDVPNLFITDGAFMTSSACQNPSLTYMAFSARAANYAADLLAEGSI